MEIDGAAAIVSGGASGLGEATVRALHARGAMVTIADVQQDKGEALAAELGERASFAATDVTSGPLMPKASDTWQAAMLAIMPCKKSGLTRLTPLV